MADIPKVDAALKRYYESLDKGDDYVNDDNVGKFEAYCEDNGIEDLDDELENEADECLLCDFDEDFPFKDEVENEKEFIYDLIKQCRANPDLSFDFALPQINQIVFDNIEQNDIDGIKEIYLTQCASIYNQGMEEDGGLCKLLAVQKKLKDQGYNIDYLQLLVDSYDRFRVKEQQKDEPKAYNPKDWVMVNGNKHFRKPLRDINISLPKAGGNNKNTAAKYPLFVSSCISSYNSRCCAKLLLNSNYKINDSLEKFVLTISAATDFISNEIQNTKALLPFQFDVCVAVGKPKDKGANQQDNESSDDEDDDDNKQDPQGYVDYIGDVKKIKQKLDNNKLKYIHSKTGDEFKEGRTVKDLINKFKDKHGFKDEEKQNYLQHNRIIAFIDRREPKVKEDQNGKPDVFLYEPPSGKFTKNIPRDAVPEWYISSARTCLLPPMDYDEKKAIAKGNIFEVHGKPADDTNIGAAFHCKGGLLVCSFHVREKDIIKCYLYYNGQIIRFFPSDIKDLLPLLFNMKEYGNQEYINDKAVDELIEKMTQKLPDKQYKAWAQTYHPK